MQARCPLTLLAATAVLILGLGVTAQRGAPPSPATSTVLTGELTIDRIQPAYAFSPGQILVEGKGLETVVEVTLGQEAIPIVSRAATTLTVAPPPGRPGFPILRVTNGVDGASRTARMLPNLQARDTGLGGRLRISLANGGSGFFVLGFSMERLETPRAVLSPPTWYGLLLDLDEPHATLAQGAFASAEVRHLTFDVPDDPVLGGKTIYFQAWCQQDFSGTGPT